jgi:hypothetical protein
MTPSIIKPTVGRRVWFRPSAEFLANNPTLTQFNSEQPMDAGIVYVHHDHMVNLIVTDHVGRTLGVPSVPLLAGQYVAGEDTDVYCCCEWMPYQKGQAAKSDAMLESFADYAHKEWDAGLARHMTGTAEGFDVPLHRSPVLNNPNTGARRDPRDAASDPQASLCMAPGEPIKAAPIALPVLDSDLDSLEREIQAKANKGPRVTPAALQAEIVSAHFFTAYQGAKAELQSDGVAANAYEEVGMLPLKLLTFCVLVLRNGFTVHGISACASPENFNAEIGQRIARENAEREIWPLLGFRLRDELARPALTEGDVAADLVGTCRPDNHTGACTACKRAD